MRTLGAVTITEMISKEEYTMEIYNKTGQDLLPENVVEDFLEIRGIDYYNVIKKRLVPGEK